MMWDYLPSSTTPGRSEERGCEEEEPVWGCGIELMPIKGSWSFRLVGHPSEVIELLAPACRWPEVPCLWLGTKLFWGMPPRTGAAAVTNTSICSDSMCQLENSSLTEGVARAVARAAPSTCAALKRPNHVRCPCCIENNSVPTSLSTLNKILPSEDVKQNFQKKTGDIEKSWNWSANHKRLIHFILKCLETIHRKVIKVINLEMFVTYTL